MHNLLLQVSFTLTITAFCVTIILLVILGFISAAEVAFFSLKPSQLKEIRMNESDTDDLVAFLLRDPKKLLASLLIAINFLNISIVIISTYFAHLFLDVESYPLLAFLLQVVVVTVLILFFGEILPKVYANQYSTRVAVIMARPMKLLVRVLNPFTSLLIASTQFADKRLARRNVNISMSELEEAIDITTNDDTPENERKILKGIVNFGETEARDIMKSRIFITAVEYNIDFQELLSVITESGYSRIPVYENNLDKVTGVLYTKDLLPFLDQMPEFQWQKLIRLAFFVPENKKISDLLEEIQLKKIHLAVVVDEYGGTSGIITLEDIIEEIVGEINDEFDTDPEELGYSRLDEHNYIFQGEIPIMDFCRIMDIDADIFDKVKGESGTLAGLILELTGKIPEAHEKINFGRFVFRIESVDQRRIQQVKVTLSELSNED